MGRRVDGCVGGWTSVHMDACVTARDEEVYQIISFLISP